MKCDDVAEVVLSDGEMSEEVVDHLEECAECRVLKESMSVLDAAGEQERQRDVPPYLVESVLREARLIQGKRFKPAHTNMQEWWLFRKMAAAAAIILLVGCGAALVQKFLAGPPSGSHMEIVNVDVAADQAMDDLRSTVRSEVARFSTMYTKNDGVSGIDADRLALRTRLSAASRDVQYELAGIK